MCMCMLWYHWYAKVLNNNLRWARRCYALWSDEVKREYYIWRDSFGLTSPAKKINDEPTIVDEFKVSLTVTFILLPLPVSGYVL
jgi:hypothetical protein